MKKQVLISSNDTGKVILDRFTALLSDRVGVDKLILFGSRARGDVELMPIISMFYGIIIRIQAVTVNIHLISYV